MAVSKDYADYVMDCISRVHLDMRLCRMFGGYCIYANEKPIMFIFNDMVCVKRHPAIEELMQGCRLINLFEDSKIGGDKVFQTWLLDIERGDIENIVYQLEKLLPMPKPKRRKRRDE
ncbi:MAG: hypothetical protein SNJ29_12545 [Rikenellaceae bacterium]